MIYLSAFQGTPVRHQASLVEHPGANDAYGVGKTELEAKAALVANLIERGGSTLTVLAETIEELRDREIVRGAIVYAEYWNDTCRQAARRLDDKFNQPRVGFFGSYSNVGFGSVQDPAGQRHDYLTKAESWGKTATTLRAHLDTLSGETAP